MANIDTLAYYEELIKGGSNELEAKAHVYALSHCIGEVVTESTLHKELQNLKEPIMIELKSIKTFGWALFISIVVPGMKYLFL